jgi:hypothetical protein
MWPWEHLAFGYVLFSLSLRVGGRRLPGDLAVVALVVGTQLSDLIDKPGAWLFGVLPSGVSLGHSLLFVVPVAVGGLLLGWRLGYRQAGWGFAVGLLSHPAGDALWYVVLGSDVPPLLWPLVPVSVDDGPFVGRIVELWLRFLELLATPQGAVYVGVELAFLLGTLALWRHDGYPGLELLRRLRRASRRGDTGSPPGRS